MRTSSINYVCLLQIPNTDGRAGMCGIVDPQGTLDLDKLAKDIAKDLPKYARPIFIRTMTSVDMTGKYRLILNRNIFTIPKLLKWI